MAARATTEAICLYMMTPLGYGGLTATSTVTLLGDISNGQS